MNVDKIFKIGSINMLIESIKSLKEEYKKNAEFFKHNLEQTKIEIEELKKAKQDFHNKVKAIKQSENIKSTIVGMSLLTILAIMFPLFLSGALAMPLISTMGVLVSVLCCCIGVLSVATIVFKWGEYKNDVKPIIKLLGNKKIKDINKEIQALTKKHSELEIDCKEFQIALKSNTDSLKELEKLEDEYEEENRPKTNLSVGDIYYDMQERSEEIMLEGVRQIIDNKNEDFSRKKKYIEE